jgi:hypothetical protein
MFTMVNLWYFFVGATDNNTQRVNMQSTECLDNVTAFITFICDMCVTNVEKNNLK